MTDQPTEHTDDTAAPRGETTADPARRGGGATAFDPTAPDRRTERTDRSEPEERMEPEERTEAEQRREADERTQPADRVEAPAPQTTELTTELTTEQTSRQTTRVTATRRAGQTAPGRERRVAGGQR